MKSKINKPSSRRSVTKSPLPLRLKTILVPVDFSPPSKKALKDALVFAQQSKAKLILLHVVEPVSTPDFQVSFPLAMKDEALIAAAKKELERIVNTNRSPQRSVERILVRLGQPYYEIAKAARECKADLIIISTHGYSGLKHVLMGSTAERVVRHAPCPVLVVRQHSIT